MLNITFDGGLDVVWYRMLYSCTPMATLGVKGLTASEAVPPRYTLSLFIVDVLPCRMIWWQPCPAGLIIAIYRQHWRHK